jgi:hypothetical protein
MLSMLTWYNMKDPPTDLIFATNEIRQRAKSPKSKRTVGRARNSMIGTVSREPFASAFAITPKVNVFPGEIQIYSYPASSNREIKVHLPEILALPTPPGYHNCPDTFYRVVSFKVWIYHHKFELHVYKRVEKLLQLFGVNT